MLNFRAGNYPEYPEPFRQSLLEQYKLCLQSADNASGRREASNRYLITLNVALLALYGLQSVGSVNLYPLVPVALAGLMVSFLSLHIIRAYKHLNVAKFDVILKLEQYLPAAALGYEWELLKKPPKGRAYWSVSDLGRHIYWIFEGLHFLLPLLVAVVLPLAGASPRSTWLSASSSRPRRGPRCGQQQSGIGHQAMVVEGDADAVGMLAWLHLKDAPFPGSVFSSKTVIPDSEEHPLTLSARL